MLPFLATLGFSAASSSFLCFNRSLLCLSRAIFFIRRDSVSVILPLIDTNILRYFSGEKGRGRC